MLLLSRLAENLFWIGRYVERAENTARLLNVNYFASLEMGTRAREIWMPLLELTGGDAELRARYGRGTLGRVQSGETSSPQAASYSARSSPRPMNTSSLGPTSPSQASAVNRSRTAWYSTRCG